MEECNCRKVKKTEKEKKELIARLNKIIGQLNGIKSMVEDDRYCVDILIQLAASKKAISSLASLILNEHIHTCLITDIKNGKLESVDEIIDLFKRFN